jgi:hypothetical protein
MDGQRGIARGWKSFRGGPTPAWEGFRRLPTSRVILFRRDFADLDDLRPHAPAASSRGRAACS